MTVLLFAEGTMASGKGIQYIYNLYLRGDLKLLVSVDVRIECHTNFSIVGLNVTTICPAPVVGYLVAIFPRLHQIPMCHTGKYY